MNSSGAHFVADLATLLIDHNKLDKVKKVVVGSSISIIEYTDRYKELYTLGDNFDMENLNSLIMSF